MTVLLQTWLATTSNKKKIYCLNNSFQCLNNITRIFIYFFTHMYFQKIQTTLLEISYQMDPIIAT